MEQPILIATAGHVDHGKSTLVRCLTGIEPDRWAEEKERGITIDLGFAHLEHEGRVYSFIDVPGHEKLVHNMLAGIGSIDAALLVIAADESLMPQTREHAVALKFLGVKQVHIIISKVDLVDEELLALMKEELDEWLAVWGWSRVEKVPFSSKIPATLTAVHRLLASLKKREPSGAGGFRLSVDRVFTSPGSGTVVTGSVDRGSITAADGLTLFSSGQAVKIRQLQLHGKGVDRVGPHARLALNLTGIHYKDLKRGDLLLGEVSCVRTRRVLVRLDLFDESWNPSANHWFHLHHLAAKLRARLLWRLGLWAALELHHPYGFWALDRGLIRDGSPLTICAGFEVWLPQLPRSKRRQVSPFLVEPPPASNLCSWQTWFLSHHGDVVSVGELTAACGAPLAPRLQAEVQFLGEGHLLSQTKWLAYQNRFLDGLGELHGNLPLHPALPLNRVVNYFKEKSWPVRLIECLIQTAKENRRLLLEGDRLRSADHQPLWNEAHRADLREFLAPLAEFPPVIDLKPFRKQGRRWELIEELLVWERFLIHLDGDLVVYYGFLNMVCAVLRRRFPGTGFTIQDLKELFHLTRKTAIPLLELFDKLGYSRRQGDERLWLARQAEPFVCNWESPVPLRFDGQQRLLPDP